MGCTALSVTAVPALFRLPGVHTGHLCLPFKPDSRCLVIAGCRTLDFLGNLVYY